MCPLHIHFQVKWSIAPFELASVAKPCLGIDAEYGMAIICPGHVLRSLHAAARTQYL